MAETTDDGTQPPPPQLFKTVAERINEIAFKILDASPDGVRFTDLKAKILDLDPTLNPNSVKGSLIGLESNFPDRVHKPARGLFRSNIFRAVESGQAPEPPTLALTIIAKAKELEFYEPIADWLTNEVEDVSRAISLGGAIFKDKWGTPDVIGKKQPKESDIVKGLIEIVSAEIKTETSQLITAFGQVCAYKLFSHKAYLVVPRQAHKDDISRLDSLCQIFGIGLVTFNADLPSAPDFRILTRPIKHEPDLFYTNKYIKLIENELFE